jgi:hypothetical protein
MVLLAQELQERILKGKGPRTPPKSKSFGGNPPITVGKRWGKKSVSFIGGFGVEEMEEP